MAQIKTISDINTKSEEGRLLLMAMTYIKRLIGSDILVKEGDILEVINDMADRSDAKNSLESAALCQQLKDSLV